MRGAQLSRDVLFSYISLEARIPKDHPLRSCAGERDCGNAVVIRLPPGELRNDGSDRGCCENG